MLNFKGRRFTIDVILVCTCWYVAYPLSYRHREEMMARINDATAPYFHTKNMTSSFRVHPLQLAGVHSLICVAY